ncbi:MAG: putative multidrug export ATP-binding/permease protein [Anaerolineales bacterium]|nr:putative multidrug export ATP-binding/permease protein [Anaerolineales bacterium]
MGFHGGGWWAFLRYDESKGKPQVDRALLKRVFGYARPYWKQAGLMLAGILASSLIQLIPPLLYRDLIDNVLPSGDITRLNLLAVAMIAVPIVGGLIDVGQRYLSARVGEGVIYDLRQQMYDHLQHMSIRFFTDTKSGEIISRFNNDVVGAQSAITGTLPNIITNVITLVTTFGIMISIEWRLAVLSVAVLPLFLIPTRRVGRILRDIRRRAMEYNADMSSMISETLSINGALLVKTFGRQRDEIGRFRDVNRKVRDIGVRRAMIGRWFFLGLGIAGAIGTALIYWFGGHLVLRDSITIGTIVAFAAYLNRLYQPISALSNVQVEFASSMVSFERVFEYLDLPQEIQDKPHAVELDTVDGRIRFEDVSFSYQAGDRGPDTGVAAGNGRRDGGDEVPGDVYSRQWALRHISFEVEPGQLVALVGPSGAGKTTVTYLFPRLYDPTEGRILLDGHDLRDVTQESLARQIGMVTQETYLFHDTVRANLLYANPDATNAELEAACRAANIHDFIAALPDGYDTVVGERGYRLSGGEKQRLAIARVILKDPRILVLDEATSHLDSQSEALIQEALERIMEERTSLVIAHRLSTILVADKILVLDRGRIVEQGAHRDLLRRAGLYAELYETQFDRKPTS